jgi:hypothetical protein
MKENHFEIANTIIMGSLKEMLANRDLTYISQTSPQHSHLTSLGEKYVLDLVKLVLPLLVNAQDLTAKENAELLMLDNLSK